MKAPCTGVILAGGMSTRFSGRDKALFCIAGQTIFDYIYKVFFNLFDEIILVTNDPLKYCQWDLNIVSDLFQTRSSLTGIHAGLFFSTNPYVFFSACDTPFLKSELVESIVDRVEQNTDLVIPETTTGLEPLCAVYSTKCLKLVEMQLEKGKFKIQSLFRKLRIKKIPENILRIIDPELISFNNINTPADLARAQKTKLRNKMFMRREL